ncbi:MAG: co-chaperone GroES [Patescibacteria group bacterium]|nr:co-chaperone GroES [Patescibacteria group bacterium]
MPAAALYQISEADDPVKEMLAQVGDLGKIEVGGARVLLWIYVRPKKTKGGIILTDRETKEDIWQATVGYVLKTGPLAFQDDESHKFGGFAAKAGDWIVFTPGEGRRRQINGVDCRIIEDALIDMKIADPAIITHSS